MDATVDGTTDGLAVLPTLPIFREVEVPDISESWTYRGYIVEFPQLQYAIPSTISSTTTRTRDIEVMNVSTEVVSGTGIPENARLTVVAQNLPTDTS